MQDSLRKIGRKTSLTIDVEEVPFATDLLEEVEIRGLISKYGEGISEVSILPEKLVEFGDHAFIGGMYQAYADHRPFTISPEMIWLLIQQGITTFLHYNVSEVIRYYPELIEKKTLAFEKNYFVDNRVEWRKIISSFTDQMKEYLDSEFVDQFKCDFSNSTPDEKAVGDLMMMDAMQPYFEYTIRLCICGIPRITIEGTESDWNRILEKLAYFKKLNLDWWFKEIEPIIDQIKSTITGNIDMTFWRNMFKVHTKDDYGEPEVIDGWITKFYPYDKKGNKILDKELSGLGVERIFKLLPSELKTIPFKFQIIDSENKLKQEFLMEFSAGFIGVRQDQDTLNLRPEIGWFVGNRTNRNPSENPYSKFNEDSREYFSLDEFPSELLEGGEFDELVLNFKNKIVYPENVAKLKVRYLELNGEVDEDCKEDLREKFKESETRVILNYDWEGIN